MSAPYTTVTPRGKDSAVEVEECAHPKTYQPQNPPPPSPAQSRTPLKAKRRSPSPYTRISPQLASSRVAGRVRYDPDGKAVFGEYWAETETPSDEVVEDGTLFRAPRWGERERPRRPTVPVEPGEFQSDSESERAPVGRRARRVVAEVEELGPVQEVVSEGDGRVSGGDVEVAEVKEIDVRARGRSP